MGDQPPARERSFNYNPDSRFRHKIEFAMRGIDDATKVMKALGHDPAPTRIDNVTPGIFKDPGAKRDYASDLVCVNCGQRFEAKAKSSDRSICVGPDQLEVYYRERSFIVFSLPSKIVVYRASDLYERRRLAVQRRNRDGEPYLDFSGLNIRPIAEILRCLECRPRAAAQERPIK